MFEEIMSFSEAGRRLDVSYMTVSDFVRKRKIPVRVHPSNGLARGLDAEGFRQLEEALRPVPVSA